jgi:hypothetical protein
MSIKVHIEYCERSVDVPEPAAAADGDEEEQLEQPAVAGHKRDVDER